MTDQPPMPPPIPRLEAVRPRDERYAAGSSQPPDPRQRRSQQLSVEQPRKSPARQVEPARRRGGWLRLLAWSVGGLVVVIGGVVALATVFLPVGLIRDELVREVKARTGRQLVVTGATSLSLWPSLAVSMGDVSLSGPPGMAGPPLVKMRRLSARAAVLPLLQRQIVIEEVVLADPVLELQVDAQGRRNWDFADLAVAPRVQFAQAKTPGVTRDTLPADLQDFVKNSSPNSSQGKPAPASAASDIAIGDINIENGTIRYRDARSGTAQDLTAINARVAAKSLQSPAEAKGTLVLRGDKVAFDARLSTPRTLMEQRPARLVLALTTPRASSHYDGTLGLAQGPALEGALKLDTASLRSLAGWLGAALPDTGGLAAMSFKGDVKTGPTWLAVSNAELRLDDTTASGTVNVDLVAGRPHIKANIKVSALDLNHYLGGGTGAQPAPAHPAPPAAAGAGSIEDLIRKSDGPPVATKGPKVKGSVQHSGWSEEPFNAVALGLADVDARIALAGLVYRQVKLGNTQLALALKSRALRVTFEDMKLYDGHGQGTLTLDATAATPTMAAVLNVDSVSALPLLKDAAGFEWLAGKAKLGVSVGGRGLTERAIMESLNGKADFAFNDGAIVGLNIPGMIRSLGQGRLAGLNAAPTDKTDFSEAGASWQIKAGIAETKDIKLVSPLLRLTGAGTVNIGQRQIDTTLRPKVVASLSGQGGAADLSGIEIPIRVRGAWEKPQIGPDMDAVMRDPNKVIDAVKEVAKQFKGRDVGDALRGLLNKGGNAPAGDGAAPQGQAGGQAAPKSNGLQALEQFLKK